ncbi:MAG: putative motility protein [Peptococcaceae bacterium]|nr:putative motility protein [Peptococcaceae bacterium]
MDIAALSIIKNHFQLKQEAGIAVMKKALGEAKQGGNLVNQMLAKANEGQAATQAGMPGVGTNIDVYV